MERTGAHQQYTWTAHYPTDVRATLDEVTAISLPELLSRAVLAHGGRPALSLADQSWSYADLQALAARAALGLQRLGIRAGDRVAVMMPNHPAVPIWFFGALSIGAVVVSINTLFAADTVQHMLRDSGAKLVLTLDSADTTEKLEPFLRSGLLSHLVLVRPDTSDLDSQPSGRALDPDQARMRLVDLLSNDGAFEPVAIEPTKALAVLQYTGGTTGVPKGVMLTHANLVINSHQIRSWFPFLRDGTERLLIPLPFSHITGISVCMVFAVTLAAELMIVPRFVPEDVLALMRKRAPTFFGGVPTVFIALMMTKQMTAGDWRSVKAILCGGAPLPPDVMRKFFEISGIPIRQIYGSTELSPAATIMPADPKEPIDAVGLPLPGTFVEIRDPAEPSRRLPTGEIGEIAVCGPQMTNGYWNRDEENGRAFVDGMFRTGDLGYFDEQGYLFIVDRLKDMIIAGGYNIYPANVESAVYSHPAVVEAIVIGVPDAYRGETVKAFVVLRDGSELTLEELQAHLKGKLSPIEMPRQLEIRERLPKTAVGKLSRLELKKEIRSSQR